jgi:sugar phosphate permease
LQESPSTQTQSAVVSARAEIPGTTQSVLDYAISRAMWRLAPYLMLLYVVSFLDRANVGFAKQALQTSVGVSESAYAMGAGLFFISYSLCGFPSNLILHKVGAKFWISFLLTCWGLVSMSTMFITGPTSFYLLRLLLGITGGSWLPSALPAPQANGPGTAEVRTQPIAREGTEAQHRSSLGR